MKFRKVPVVVDAFKWQPGAALPDWVAVGGCREKLILTACARNRDGVEVMLSVETNTGRITAFPGDWVIRDASGELSCCKPSIFAMAYEPVDGWEE